MSSPAARWAPVALAVAFVTTSGLAAATADDPALSHDRGLSVLVPRDGAQVGEDFLLAWSPGRHDSQLFAVLVDRPVPAPGAPVEAGPSTVLVRGTALRLTLTPRSGGSPTARNAHQVVVIPLDARSRRVGESVAVVHLRGAG